MELYSLYSLCMTRKIFPSYSHLKQFLLCNFIKNMNVEVMTCTSKVLSIGRRVQTIYISSSFSFNCVNCLSSSNVPVLDGPIWCCSHNLLRFCLIRRIGLFPSYWWKGHSFMVTLIYTILELPCVCVIYSHSLIPTS